jgi:hypothetical protein
MTQIRPRSLDELMFHWPTVIRRAETDWARTFARSVAVQSRRRNWQPSPKQRQIMISMVSDLFSASAYRDSDSDNLTVIDDD